MEGIELIFYVKKNIIYSILLCILIAGLFLLYKYHYVDSKVINVQDYGAKGDGITDDTRAIQKAFNTVTRTKTNVYFPSGTYMINPNNNVFINSHTNVFGDGAGSIIKANKSDFGRSLLYISGRNIKISKLSFDGNNAVNRVLVVQARSSNVQISNSLVSNATHSNDRSSDMYSAVVAGIIVYGNTDTITIDQTEIRNIIALHPLSGSLIARGIYITNTWGSVEKSSTNLSIINSNIHDIGPADDGDGIYYEDPYLDKNIVQNTNSTIANNTFYNCAKRAIKLYANGILVTGNHIVNDYFNNNYYQGSDKGKLAPDMYAGISIYGNNIKVAKNIFEGKGSYYSAIEISSSKTVKNIEVSENKITMGAHSNTRGTTSIRMGDIEDFTITSNVLENGERGIWSWQNATRGTITENIINMPEGGGIDLSTYLVNYYQINILCANNMITAKDFSIRVPKDNSTIQLD
jgi:uncharacterized membrane protein YobD (UPF0266 family)